MASIESLASWAEAGRALARRANSGWTRIAYGVWVKIRPGRNWQIWEDIQRTRARSALQMSGEGTALDGMTAAMIYGAPIPHRPWTIELITGVKHSRHNSKCRVKNAPPEIAEATVLRSSRTLPDEAFIEVDGMRIVRWDYLCVELLARHPARHSVPPVDWLIHQQIARLGRDRDAVEHAFSQILSRLETILARRKDPRGRRRARRNLKLISPWPESPGESLMRLELTALGFPKPVEQHEVRVENSRFFTDFAYPEVGVALEFDGYMKYESASGEWSRRALTDERARENLIRRVLPHVERFSWDEIRSGEVRKKLLRLRARLFPQQRLRTVRLL